MVTDSKAEQQLDQRSKRPHKGTIRLLFSGKMGTPRLVFEMRDDAQQREGEGWDTTTPKPGAPRLSLGDVGREEATSRREDRERLQRRAGEPAP